MAQRKIITEFTVEEFREFLREEFQNANFTQSPPRTGKRFYPIEWLEEYTGIPRSSIYQKTSKNLIPHSKRGRKLFFDKNLIDKWLEEGNVKTTAEIKAEAEDFLTKRGRNMR